jgi:protein TonB
MSNVEKTPPGPGSPSGKPPAEFQSHIDLELMLGEDPKAKSRIRNFAIVAVVFHVVLFAIHFPKSKEVKMEEIVEVTPIVIKVRVIPPPNIPPPPTQKVEKKIRMAVPDPTPDEPEPIRPPEPEIIDIPPLPPGAQYVIGIPDGPPAPSVMMEGAAGSTRAIKVSGPEPDYPDEARRLGLDGEVMLLITVNENGDVVGDVSVIQEAPFGMTESAIRAVKKWKYQPSTLNGRPITVQKVETIRFVIQQ